MNVTPKVCIDYRTLRREINANGTMATYNKLKHLWYETKRVTEYKWDNIKIRVSNIYGESFAMAVYDNVLVLWDETGGTHLGDFKMTDNDFEDWRSFVETMEEWSRAIIKCNRCGKKINYHESLNRRYFAGLYCQECWDSEMKAIEAKETYN